MAIRGLSTRVLSKYKYHGWLIPRCWKCATSLQTLFSLFPKVFTRLSLVSNVLNLLLYWLKRCLFFFHHSNVVCYARSLGILKVSDSMWHARCLNKLSLIYVLRFCTFPLIDEYQSSSLLVSTLLLSLTAMLMTLTIN